FLVRSGVLTSVHAFATDPARGVFILLLIVAATGGSLILYAIRMPGLKSGSPFSIVSREAGLTLNNVILTVACATVFLGTFYPLIVDLMGRDKISVGPPYYNMTFVPIMIPLLIAMSVGPMLKWKRDTLREALDKLKPAAIAAGVALLVVLGITFGKNIAAGLAIALAAWLVVGSLINLGMRLRIGQVPLGTSLGLARTTPRSFFGLVLAHAGMGLTVLGIAGMSAWATETIQMVRPGGTISLSGYDLKFASVNNVPGPNYDAERAVFNVTRNGRFVTVLETERRFYPVREQQTTVAGIRTNLLSNIYVVIGEPDKKGAWQVRLYYHPLVPWIWLGALIMALGGFVSLSDRRFRVGAPARQKTGATLAPAE
ncbi:MAG: cytochrome c-type biogenesis CcmF C-terminal domain-containing protein, partial [Hyphomicrobium sp.]